MSNLGHLLGIYETTGQLDHDMQILVEQLLDDLASRGVARSQALASARRVVKAAS